MMEDFPEEGFNLEEMDSGEKDELIQKLARAYNTQMTTSISLYNAMVVFEARLLAGNKLGIRQATIHDVAARMHMVSGLALQWLDIDEEQLKVDSAFEDIIADMED